MRARRASGRPRPTASRPPSASSSAMRSLTLESPGTRTVSTTADGAPSGSARGPGERRTLVEIPEAPKVFFHLAGLGLGDRGLIRHTDGAGGLERRHGGFGAHDLVQDPPP